MLVLGDATLVKSSSVWNCKDTIWYLPQNYQWKIHHLSRCISYWTWEFSSQSCQFSGMHSKRVPRSRPPNQCRSPLLYGEFFCPKKHVAKSGRSETMSPYKPLWRPWRCALVEFLGQNDPAWEDGKTKTPARGKQQHQGTHIVSLGGCNSNVFNFHPDPWGKWSNLTSIFSKWVEITN